MNIDIISLAMLDAAVTKLSGILTVVALIGVAVLVIVAIVQVNLVCNTASTLKKESDGSIVEQFLRFTYKQPFFVRSPSDEEIFPLVAISEFLIQRGFVFCRAIVSGGASSTHDGVAAYANTFEDLYQFRDNHVSDFVEKERGIHEESEGWFDSCEYGDVSVYLKKAKLRLSVTYFCRRPADPNVFIQWFEYTKKDNKIIEMTDAEMRRILGECSPSGRQVITRKYYDNSFYWRTHYPHIGEKL